jgi:hypothetical protein
MGNDVKRVAALRRALRAILAIFRSTDSVYDSDRRHDRRGR